MKVIVYVVCNFQDQNENKLDLLFQEIVDGKKLQAEQVCEVVVDSSQRSNKREQTAETATLIQVCQFLSNYPFRCKPANRQEKEVYDISHINIP